MKENKGQSMETNEVSIMCSAAQSSGSLNDHSLKLRIEES